MEVHNAEGAATNKQRLEVLEEQEELIQDENKQAESVKETTGTEVKVKDDQDLDDKEEVRKIEAEAEADGGESAEAEQSQPDHEQVEPKQDDTKR